MPIFDPKRFITFGPAVKWSLGILPPAYRVSPDAHILIRDPKWGVEKNLIAEAKKNGTYESTILNMPVNDPRHPYYTEYLWVTYANVDFETLSPAEKFQAWQARMFRFTGRWACYGLLYDDVAFHSQWWAVREAIKRMPAEVRIAREKRLSGASELILHDKELDLDDQPPAEADVAYLQPHFRMVLDEWNESKSYV